MKTFDIDVVNGENKTKSQHVAKVVVSSSIIIFVKRSLFFKIEVATDTYLSTLSKKTSYEMVVHFKFPSSVSSLLLETIVFGQSLTVLTNLFADAIRHLIHYAKFEGLVFVFRDNTLLESVIVINREYLFTFGCQSDFYL